MDFQEMRISGSWLVKPRVFTDERGEFYENFKVSEVSEATGYKFDVKQVNASLSAAGVVRGIHWADVPPGQAKYVSCTQGSIIDFVIDLRIDSPTFGEWDSALLSGNNNQSLFIPVGLGHAFIALENDTKVNYLCSEPYNPTIERSINPLDQSIGLDFDSIMDAHGISNLITSEKDTQAGSLNEFIEAGLLPKFR